MNTKIALTILSAVISCSILVACNSSVSQPKTKLLSPTQTTELLASATHVEPVGEAVVNVSASDTTTIITTTQLFSFRLKDDTGGSTSASCVGSCRVAGPGGLSGCKTSGCFPTSTGGCTPLVCSGNCNLSSACSAGTSMTVFWQ